MGLIEPIDKASVWDIPSVTVAVNGHEKHLIASLRLAREVYSVYGDARRETLVPESDPRVNAAMQALMVDLMANYQGTFCQEDLRKIFANTDRCSDFDFLRRCSVGAIPVALIRALLHRDRVAFDAYAVPHWDVFAHSSYATPILR